MKVAMENVILIVCPAGFALLTPKLHGPLTHVLVIDMFVFPSRDLYFREIAYWVC